MRYALIGLCLVVSGAAYADPDDVKFQLNVGYNFKKVFGLPAYGPPSCGYLKAKAQALATPIIAGATTSLRDIRAAVEAAKAYRKCAETTRFGSPSG